MLTVRTNPKYHASTANFLLTLIMSQPQSGNINFSNFSKACDLTKFIKATLPTRCFLHSRPYLVFLDSLGPGFRSGYVSCFIGELCGRNRAIVLLDIESFIRPSLKDCVLSLCVVAINSNRTREYHGSTHTTR